MAVLFTFGCGTLGELGTNRPDDTKRPESVAVAFPQSVQQSGADEININSIALGNDHSLAAVGGSVYRWGLLGANVDMRPRRTPSAPDFTSPGPPAKPEVVPTPTAISQLVGVRLHSAAETDDSRGLEGQVRAVTCGGSNSFFLTSTGEVFMLGNLRPPGGETDCVRHLWGTMLGGPTARVLKVAAGWRHCLLLTEAGQVFALGDDEHGQCAGMNGATVAIPLPSEHAVVGIAAGACHSGAWDRAGSAFTWGHAGSGRLGLDGSCNRRTPARVHKLPENVSRVSCGANFTIFVTNSGRSLWACGGNQYGQLGLGGTDRSPQIVPVRVGFPRADDSVIDLQCGANHVLCITGLPAERTGSAIQPQPVVWAWGCASSGQCGRAEGEQQGSVPPAARSTPEALADFAAPSPHWAVAVAAGRSHSAVLAHNGQPPRISDFRSPKARRGQSMLPEPPAASPELRVSPGGMRLLSRLPRSSRRLPDAPAASSPKSATAVKAISTSPVPTRFSMSPLPLPVQPDGSRSSALRGRQDDVVQDETILVEDDIIDMFCARLHSHSTPPSCAGRDNRSPSPVEGLVRLGEAALNSAVDVTMEEKAPMTGTPESMLHRSGSRRMVATGAAVHQWNLRTNSRSQTPPKLRSEQLANGTTWPRPPPSWAAAASGRRSSPPNALKKGPQNRGSLSRERKTLREPAYTAGYHSSPSVSPVAAQPSWVANSFAVAGAAGTSPPGVSALGAAALRLDILPSPPPVQLQPPDQWTGIRESLKGLSSMIANIGAPARTIPVLPAWDSSLSGGNAGDLAAGSHIAGFASQKLGDVYSGDFGNGRISTEGSHHHSSALLETSMSRHEHGNVYFHNSMHRKDHALVHQPPLPFQQQAYLAEQAAGGMPLESFQQQRFNAERAAAAHAAEASVARAAWERANAAEAQSPSGLLEFDQGVSLAQVGTPGDNRSETALDFSPRSTGSASFGAQEQMRSQQVRAQVKGRSRGPRSDARSRPAIPLAPPATMWGAPPAIIREPISCPEQSIEHSLFVPSPGPVAGTVDVAQADTALPLAPRASEQDAARQLRTETSECIAPWASRASGMEAECHSAEIVSSTPKVLDAGAFAKLPPSLPPLQLETSSGVRSSNDLPALASPEPTPPRTPPRSSPRQSSEVSAQGSTAAALTLGPMVAAPGAQEPMSRQITDGSSAAAAGVSSSAAGTPRSLAGAAPASSAPAGSLLQEQPLRGPGRRGSESSVASTTSKAVSFAGQVVSTASAAGHASASRRVSEESSPFVMGGDDAAPLVPGLDPDSEENSSEDIEEDAPVASIQAGAQPLQARLLSNRIVDSEGSEDDDEDEDEDEDDEEDSRDKAAGEHRAEIPIQKKATSEDSSEGEGSETSSVSDDEEVSASKLVQENDWV